MLIQSTTKFWYFICSVSVVIYIHDTTTFKHSFLLIKVIRDVTQGQVACHNIINKILSHAWKTINNPFYKISSYQGFTIKQTLIGWVCFQMRTVIRFKKRNVELIMSRIKCKQPISFYDLNALINKSKQVGILKLYTNILLTVRPSLYHPSARFP